MGGLAFSGSSKSFIHPKGIFSFIVFVFCFHLRERAGRGKKRGKAKREKKERWGKEKKKGLREKEKGGLFGLGILWIIKIIHSSKRDFQFHCFCFLFSFERESGKRKEKGESKKGEEGE